VAALLSLLINKHGQKGDRNFNKCRACPNGSIRCKKSNEAKMREEKVAAKKHSSDYFTVAVKSSGGISAEPVRGQKIEECVVTDLYLRNHEKRPSSSAVAKGRQDVSLKNTIDEIADAITGGNNIGLPFLWPASISEKMREYWLKYETGSF